MLRFEESAQIVHSLARWISSQCVYTVRIGMMQLALSSYLTEESDATLNLDRLRLCVILYAVAALSESPRNTMPANCKEKQSVQLLSSGDPVEGDTSKVTCTVRYWVCGQHFTQSQVAPNQPGACERFTSSVRSKIGGEACCDCFPKCAVGEPARRKPSVAASETRSHRHRLLRKVEQLEEQVRQLEARLKALEDRLSGEEVTLNVSRLVDQVAQRQDRRRDRHHVRSGYLDRLEQRHFHLFRKECVDQGERQPRAEGNKIQQN